MTLRYFDGFNDYSTMSEFAATCETAGTLGSLVTGRRTGSKAIQVYAGNGGTTAPVKFFDDQPTWIWGAAVNITYECAIVAFRTSAGEQISLRQTTNGQLYVSRNGTTLWSSGSDPNYKTMPGTWTYLEFSATFSTTAGAWSLRVNGSNSTLVSQTSVNTAAQGGTTANRLAIGGSGSSFGNIQQFADMYLCDATTSVCNSMLGDCRVDPLLPTADGTHSDFAKSTGTTAYNLINDLNNGDTNYISSSTVGALTTVNAADMPYTPTYVYGVKVANFARKDDSGARGVKNAIRTNGADYVGTEKALSTSYSLTQDLWGINPATGVLFTLAEINALEIGVQVSS